MDKLGESDRSKELGYLRALCITIVRFVSAESRRTEIFVEVERAITEAYESANVRAMRAIFKDIKEWTDDLSMAQRRGLEELLVSQFGKGLREFGRREERDLERILKSGRIRNDEEFRLVSKEAEKIYADEGKAAELKRINALLADYEMKT
jgi:hypothetical protein